MHRLAGGEGQGKAGLFSTKANTGRCSSAVARPISVRLICATTEPVSSALLRTFQRRIQVCIDLLGIRQRSVEEQAELIVGFYSVRVRKIERTISIDRTLPLGC